MTDIKTPTTEPVTTAHPIWNAFRSLFRRAAALVSAFRDSVTGATKRAYNASKRGVRRVTNTSAGKIILSTFGMFYMARVAYNSTWFLVHSVGYGTSYVIANIVAGAFLVLSGAWLLAFAKSFYEAITSPVVATYSEPQTALA